MADFKISQLDALSSGDITRDDVIIINEGDATTKKTTLTSLFASDEVRDLIAGGDGTGDGNVGDLIPDPDGSDNQPGTLDDRYVNIVGDNMTGALTIGPDGGPAVTTINADGKANFSGRLDCQDSVYVGTKPNDVLAISDGSGLIALSAEQWGGGSSAAMVLAPANGTAPVYVFSNESLKLGGTLPGDPHIELNTGNGYANFNGQVTSGDDPTGGAATGAILNQTGVVKAGRATETDVIWQGFHEGEATATSEIRANGAAIFASGQVVINASGVLDIQSSVAAADASTLIRAGSANVTGGNNAFVVRADGSATFAGSISSGETTGGDVTKQGCYFDKDGGVYVMRPNGSTQNVFSGFQLGNTSPTVYIKADGSATFAGDIEANNVTFAAGTADEIDVRERLVTKTAALEAIKTAAEDASITTLTDFKAAIAAALANI